MTTIIATATRMMADSYIGSDSPFRTAKIYKVGKTLCGYCGNDMGNCLKIIEWLSTGKKKKDKPTIKGDNDVLQIDGKTMILWDKHLVPIIVTQEVYTMGSGGAYAMGALSFGATFEEAMEIAAKHCNYTKPPFVDMKI